MVKLVTNIGRAQKIWTISDLDSLRILATLRRDVLDLVGFPRWELLACLSSEDGDGVRNASEQLPQHICLRGYSCLCTSAVRVATSSHLPGHYNGRSAYE